MKKYLLVIGVAFMSVGCGLLGTSSDLVTSDEIAATTTIEVESNATKGMKVMTESGLQYEVLIVGKGNVATKGDKVKVHYTGWLTDGTKFDSSVDRGTPFEFLLGARQVIVGWDEGVAGMAVGETRRLTIPSDLAYGNQKRGKIIPAGATLIFDVELLGIKK